MSRLVVRDIELDVDLHFSRRPCTGLGVPHLGPTATSSAILFACSTTRIAEVTAVEVQLWDSKSGTRTSTGVQVHIKLYISNNQPRPCQKVALERHSGDRGPSPESRAPERHSSATLVTLQRQPFVGTLSKVPKSPQ
jgi:hypothetical protein